MSEDLEPGAHIGRFVVVRRLGAGGMGAVFEARDPELSRSVAVKVLRDRGGDTIRLLREAQALARISHPNVIGVFELGSHDGQVFVAMELVDGETLDKRLARATQWREKLALVIAAGRGLAAVHAQGLVHRDVKPSNILVDAHDRVRIGDFGLARLDEGQAAAPSIATAITVDGKAPSDGALTPASDGVLESPLTEEGAVIGTPRYMAPEQHAGLRVTRAADQFAFCVVAWEALYGEHPFGESREIVAAVIAGRRRLAPKSAVPSWLERALARGLASDPAARWPSMNALLDELELRPRRRRRRAIAAAMLTAIGAATAGGFLIAHRGGGIDCAEAGAAASRAWTPPVRTAIVDAFRATGASYAPDAASRAAGSLDRWLDDWRGARVDACRATHDRGEQSAAMLDKRIACLDDQLAAFRALVGALQHADRKAVERSIDAVGLLPAPDLCSPARLADTAAPSGDVRVQAVVQAIADAKAARDLRGPQSIPTAERALAAARALGDPGLRARALYAHARVVVSKDPAGARKELDDAQTDAAAAHDPAIEADVVEEILEEAITERDVARIEALLPVFRAALRRAGDPPSEMIYAAETEADAAIALDKPDEARAACKRAEELAGGDRAKSIAIDCACAVAIQIRDIPGGVDACPRAYARRKAAYGAENPRTKGGADMAIIALDRAGRPDEAAAIAAVNVPLTERLFGEQSSEMLNELGNLATIQDMQGKPEEAAATLRRGIAILDAMHAPRDQHRYAFRNDLAEREAALGQIDAAVKDADAALAAAEELLGPDAGGLVGVLLTDAKVHRAAKDLPRARALLDRARAIGEAKKQTSLLAGVLEERGRLEVEDHHAADAVPLFERALELEAAAHERALLVADTHRHLAEALDAVGRRKDALAHMHAARDGYASLGDRAKPNVDAVDAWLAAHAR